MTLAEPRFDIDLAYGKQGELLVRDQYLDWIAKRNGQVETKTKRRLDLNLFVETECDYGRQGNYQPSGINVSTAAAWAWVIGESGVAVIVPADLLKEALKHRSVRSLPGPRGDCPTKGKLVHLAAIIDTYRQKQEA